MLWNDSLFVPDNFNYMGSMETLAQGMCGPSITNRFSERLDVFKALFDPIQCCQRRVCLEDFTFPQVSPNGFFQTLRSLRRHAVSSSPPSTFYHTAKAKPQATTMLSPTPPTIAPLQTTSWDTIPHHPKLLFNCFTSVYFPQ